jgi:IS1 family transposase
MRNSRKIVSYSVIKSKKIEDFQTMIGIATQADFYFTDGFLMCQNLDYLKKHIVAPLKCQTFTVEGINADLRRYIAGLQLRIRTFFRSM